ncbi:MAG: hypothetical protein JNJ46_08355 [Myxococcales bacterium]|nr:hypothetical protein [Myxococcales bacterium]
MLKTCVRGGRALFLGSVLASSVAIALANPVPRPAAATATPATGPAASPSAGKPLAKPAARPVAKPVAKPTPPSKPPPPPAPPACTAGDFGMTLLETESDMKCDEEWNNCSGEILVAARNCTSEFQSLVRVEIFEGPRRSQVLEFSPAPIVPPQTVWREGIPWASPADLEIEVFYRPPGQQGGEVSSRGRVHLTHKALAAAQAQCAKCQGTWGRFGVNKVAGCNCKTSDAGKECMDGEECEGYCMFVRYDTTGREHGLCSETTKLTGCHNIIYKGASKEEPVVPPPRKRPTCVD